MLDTDCLELHGDSQEFTPNPVDVEAILHDVMIMTSEAQLSLVCHIRHANNEVVHL